MPYTERNLDPGEKQKWSDTLSLLQWSAPGFNHLLYKLLRHGNELALWTDQIPTAATDGSCVLVNPDWFFTLTLPERCFVMVHEIIHCVYDDPHVATNCMRSGHVPMTDGTVMPFNNGSSNRAQDFRINAMLKEAGIGIMPKQGCYDPAIAVGNDSWFDVYKKVYDPQDDEGGPGHNPGGGFDQTLAPGSSGKQGNRNQQQWNVEMATCRNLEEKRHRGNLPGGIGRMFKDILEPEIPWTEHIRSIISRKLGSGGYNWRKPERRAITRDLYIPSRSGFGAGTIVVWGDTSGSIAEPELESYMGELKGIIEDCRPQRLIVLWCDAAIHKVSELEDANDLLTLKSEGVGGGGGTSVLPCFDWMQENLQSPPDMFLGFTDLECDFPRHTPSFPVIWACVDKENKAPFGDVVRINTKHHK